MKTKRRMKMLKLKGIDHLNISVKNLDETIKFYRDIFGFEIKEKGVSPTSGRDYAIIGNSDRGFLAAYELKDFDSEKRGNINHLGFNIENFDKALDFLEKSNVTIGYGEGVIDYPQSKSIYVLDPNGIEIELSENFGGGL